MRHTLAIAALGCATLLGPMPRSAAAACGCSGMTLSRAGTTGTMCSDNDLTKFLPHECTQYAGGTKGCATTYAYDCQLGVNNQKLGNVKPYQRTGFMPTAAYTGTLTDCTLGQVLQESITSWGSPANNPFINPTSLSGAVSLAGKAVNIDNLATQRFPQKGATGTGGNPLFGGDNYASAADPTVLFNVTPGTVSWWDNPDQTKSSKGEVATWDFRFISFVNGSAGQPSCACAFTITVNWNGTTPPTTVWAKDNALSTNCTF